MKRATYVRSADGTISVRAIASDLVHNGAGGYNAWVGTQHRFEQLRLENPDVEFVDKTEPPGKEPA